MNKILNMTNELESKIVELIACIKKIDLDNVTFEYLDSKTYDSYKIYVGLTDVICVKDSSLERDIYKVSIDDKIELEYQYSE